MIQLNDAVQGLKVIPLCHRLYNFLLETPGAVVGNANLAPQGQGRQTRFGLSQQMDRQKPHRERQISLLKQLAADQRSLMMTCRALIQVAGLVQTIVMGAITKTLKTG